MADILEMLMSVLCQQNTLQQCQQFVQAYPDLIQQTIYFAFFPTVFVILFIHVLSGAIAKNIGEKYKILIGISIFVFIVLQGWYHYLLLLSRFWFISIIVLGGFYAFMNMGIGRQDGGGGKIGGKPLKSIGDYVKKRTATAIRGDEKSLNDRIRREMDAVEVLEKQIRRAESRKPEPDAYGASMYRQQKMMKMEEIEALIRELNQMTSFEGTDIGKSPDVKKHKNWLKEHQKK